MKEKIKDFFNFKKDISYLKKFWGITQEKAPMFALFIRVAFLIIKWSLFLLIVVVFIYGTLRINWGFFIYSKTSKKCMAEYGKYLYEKNISICVKDLSGDKIKDISQLWYLNQGTLLKIKEEDTEKAVERQHVYLECKKSCSIEPRKFIDNDIGYSLRNALDEIDNKYTIDIFCTHYCRNDHNIEDYTKVGALINEQLEKGITPNISNMSINELNSKGICSRPSFFK